MILDSTMSVIIIILLYICKCVSCGLLDDFPESFGDFFSKDFDFKLPNVSGLQPEFYAFEPKGFRVEVPGNKIYFENIKT